MSFVVQAPPVSLLFMSPWLVTRSGNNHIQHYTWISSKTSTDWGCTSMWGCLWKLEFNLLFFRAVCLIFLLFFWLCLLAYLLDAGSLTGLKLTKYVSYPASRPPQGLLCHHACFFFFFNVDSEQKFRFLGLHIEHFTSWVLFIPYNQIALER